MSFFIIGIDLAISKTQSAYIAPDHRRLAYILLIATAMPLGNQPRDADIARTYPTYRSLARGLSLGLKLAFGRRPIVEPPARPALCRPPLVPRSSPVAPLHY